MIKYLFLLKLFLLSESAPAATYFSSLSPQPTQVAVSITTTCYAQPDAVTCIGGFGEILGRHSGFQNIHQISFSDPFICVLDDGGVTCLASSQDSIRDIPSLQHPKQISTGLNFACAIDDEGLSCWGEGAPKNGFFKKLKNANHLASDFTRICVTSDNGLECWSSFKPSPTPRLSVPVSSVKKLIVANDRGCILARERIICWGNNYNGQSTVPKNIQHPRDLFSSRNFTCAQDERGLECWGLKNQSWELATKAAVKESSEISFSNTAGCAIVKGGIICSGDEMAQNLAFVDQLQYPDQIFASGNQNCAIENEELSCWGSSLTNWVFHLPSRKIESGDQVLLSPNGGCVRRSGKLECAMNSGGGTLIAIPSLENPIEISLGDQISCVRNQEKTKCTLNPALNFSGEIFPAEQLPAYPFAIQANYAEVCAANEKVYGCINSTHQKREVLWTTPLSHPQKITMGIYHACAVDDLGVQCVGTDGVTRQGTPSFQDHIDQLVSGAEFACALHSERVTCWGEYQFGILDIPKDLKHVRQIAAGANHVCALDEEGMKCWGSNFYGQASYPAKREN